MPAQALLSVVAPLVPPASSGAAIADASAFKGLLTGLIGDAETTGAGPLDDPEVEAGEAAGFLSAPAPLPATPMVIHVPGPAPETLSADAGPDPAIQAPKPALMTGAAAAPSGANPAASPAVPTADAPPPAEATADSPATEPGLPATALAPTNVDDGAGQLTPAEPAPAQAAMTSAPPPPQSLPPLAPPPPLKALAERTTEPETAETSASTPDDAARPAVADASPTTGDGVQPAEPAVKPSAATAAPVREPSKPAPDGPPPPGPEAAISPTSSNDVRDVSLSTLSRATIDATAQIAAQILRKLEGRSTRFEMALTPDALGRVDVKLDIDSEGRLAARLAFDNPAAATDLRGRADELRRQLEAQGFHLADDAFEFTQRDSGSHAFDRGQDPRGGHARAFASAARLNAETDAAPPRWVALSLSPSGVDMKV